MVLLSWMYSCPGMIRPKPPNGAPAGYKIVLNGSLSYLVDGKVIDSNMYAVEALKAQGVKLRHVGDF